jgi:hypothetical protein
MRIPIFAIILVLVAAVIHFLTALAQSSLLDPQVISPRPGDAVQGSVEISGITGVEGFLRADIEFRYTNDPKDTWFLINETDKPVNPGKISDWDTTTISDETYDLRITVHIIDGTSRSVMVPGIRVRNYLPVETPTPPIAGNDLRSVPTISTTIPTRTPRPTRVPLQENPAVLTGDAVNSSLFRGGAAGIGFFLAFAIYWVVKKSLS